MLLQIFKAKLRKQQSRWTLKKHQLDALADNYTTDMLVCLFVCLFIYLMFSLSLLRADLSSSKLRAGRSG